MVQTIDVPILTPATGLVLSVSESALRHQDAHPQKPSPSPPSRSPPSCPAPASPLAGQEYVSRPPPPRTSTSYKEVGGQNILQKEINESFSRSFYITESFVVWCSQ